jgi:uncharacterized protein
MLKKSSNPYDIYLISTRETITICRTIIHALMAYNKFIKFKVQFQTMSLSCPNCSTEMTLNNRAGVEIDQCPRCKGVWLDRGELEKVANMQNRYEDEHYQKYHYGRGHDDDNDDYYRSRKHKKGGFLGDLFDFG